MGSYKVIAGQNIYDVALHVYGSVEGITDLLANNESLSLEDDLQAGDMLFYTDGYRINKEVVAYYQTHGITPASGELHVYPKSFSLPLTVELYLSHEAISTGFTVSGHGKLEIDWGDNSAAEVVTADGNPVRLNHLFDSPVGGKRKVSLYMEGRFQSLDFSELRLSELYILRPVYVERFVLKNAALSIESLPLLSGVFELCLDGLKTEVLTPLLELKGLMLLSLCGTVFRQPAIDDYLTGLVKQHDNRRSCRVVLECEPSGECREPAKDANGRYVAGSGMEAIWVLTHEPAWNEGAPWEFVINDRIYRYEQNDSTNL
jgi:hypothetical protein